MAKIARDPNPPKNARQHEWRQHRDWGWTFSRRLVERVARRTGQHERDVSYLASVFGEEIFQMLAEGRAVGLPHCPVLYTRRVLPDVERTPSKGYRQDHVAMFRTRVHMPKRLRTIRMEAHVERGTLREQFEAERLRILGKPRTKKWTRD